jgi:PAS domain S-box-containing protein
MNNLSQRAASGLTTGEGFGAEPDGRRLRELEAILESLIDGVFVIDIEARFTVANSFGAEMHGLRPEDVLGRSIYDFPAVLRMRHFDGRPLRDDEHPLARALGGELVRDFEKLIFNRETGRDVYLRLNASPVRDASGALIGAVEIARDVTGLHELDELKDQFIGVAAHELKTPIAIIKGYVGELLRSVTDLPPARRRMLDAIARGTTRLTDLVQDLLDISQLHLGQMDLVTGRVDLAEIIECVASAPALRARGRDVHIRPLRPTCVRADADRVKKTIETLVDNAIRYSPDGSAIDVELRVAGDAAIVTVGDHGVGIPRDRQPRIFERFYRAHTDTPFDAGGMGVSLFIGRAVMRQMGGDLWFETEEGRGSRFFLSAPLWGRGDERG